jgi:DNA-binding winged helix-turn-helix (wHTH) protein
VLLIVLVNHCGRFELSRRGRRLKLERKPLELLVLLVTKHGQVVTRDEIAKCLWEQEVFVDIEHGINTAIRKIRQTLGDGPDLPPVCADNLRIWLPVHRNRYDG